VSNVIVTLPSALVLIEVMRQPSRTSGRVAAIVSGSCWLPPAMW